MAKPLLLEKFLHKQKKVSKKRFFFLKGCKVGKFKFPFHCFLRDNLNILRLIVHYRFVVIAASKGHADSFVAIIILVNPNISA